MLHIFTMFYRMDEVPFTGKAHQIIVTDARITFSSYCFLKSQEITLNKAFYLGIIIYSSVACF